MHLSIPKLGRIRNLNIDVKPLTILIGNNGTGKTWTTYIYASLASQISRERTAHNFDYSGKTKLTSLLRSYSKEVTETIRRLEDNQTAEIEIEKASIYDLITSSISLTQDYKAISSYTGMEMDPDVKASISFNKSETIVYKSRGKLIRVAMSKRSNFAFIDIEIGKRTLISLFLNKRLLESSELESRIPTALLSSVFKTYNSIVPFPAERKALMLIYPLLLQMINTEDDSGEDSRAISNSIRRFINRPATLSKFINMLSASQYGFVRPDKQFKEISGILEREVIKAKLSHRGDQGSEGLGVSIEGMPELELDSVHSLVRSLGGLDIYLKSAATKDDLLLIDEPEMNAHPEAQIRIAELIGILVNSGLNVFMTTHSPYIIDQVSNLVHISGQRPDKRNDIISILKLKNENAVLSSRKVSAYLIDEEGVVSDIFADKKEYIDWRNFGSASDYLSDLSNAISTEE